MNAEKDIFSLLNPKAEMLYWNHRKLEQRFALYPLCILLIGLPMITWSPIICSLLMIAALFTNIYKNSPQLNFTHQQRRDLVNWKYARRMVMEHPDYEVLVCLIQNGTVAQNGIKHHPKFKAIASRYLTIPGTSSLRLVLA